MLVTHMCALSLLTLRDFAFVKCRRLKKMTLRLFSSFSFLLNLLLNAALQRWSNSISQSVFNVTTVISSSVSQLLLLFPAETCHYPHILNHACIFALSFFILHAKGHKHTSSHVLDIKSEALYTGPKNNCMEMLRRDLVQALLLCHRLGSACYR